MTCSGIQKLTAIGFASVLTNREVIFKVRDILADVVIFGGSFDGRKGRLSDDHLPRGTLEEEISGKYRGSCQDQSPREPEAGGCGREGETEADYTVPRCLGMVLRGDQSPPGLEGTQ